MFPDHQLTLETRAGWYKQYHAVAEEVWWVVHKSEDCQFDPWLLEATC